MIKDLLIEEYKKYYDKYKKTLWEILYVQGKGVIRDKLKSSEDSIKMLETIIMGEDYYVTNIDIWLLINRFNIPLLFISEKKKPLKENGKIYIKNNNYYLHKEKIFIFLKKERYMVDN